MREALEILLSADTPLFVKRLNALVPAQMRIAIVLRSLTSLRCIASQPAALVSTYMSSVAHRSNEVMKVLTMVSSIFVPMTFLAGVYGMNFEYMPELSHPWSYPLGLARDGGERHWR